jgi:hypothetical protein
MKSEPVQLNVRKLVPQMLAGGVVGLLAVTVGDRLLPDLPAAAGPGAAVLFGVGAMYAVMGLFVGLGVAIPSLGARMLNVADHDDLADQRAMLTGSAVCCISLGLALMLLAYSGPESEIPSALAIGALAVALSIYVGVTVAQWRLYDELMRGLWLESSAIMAGIAFPAISLWAALAHNGLLAPIDPLGLIAGLAGSMLLATFIAVGRRGLLMPH